MKYQQLVFDQLAIVVWKDLKGHFLGMNQMALDTLKVEIGDVIGKRDEDFFPKELIEGYRRDDQEVILTGRAKHLKETVSDSDGNPIELSVTKTPLSDQKGEIIGVIVVAIPKG